MKHAKLMVLILTIISTTRAMATKADTLSWDTASTVSEVEISSYLNAFEQVMKIPQGYLFQSARKVTADQVPAYVFRFEKQEHPNLGGEHFSFIISADRQVLGFTHMDRKYAHDGLLSKAETEKIAKQFLSSIDHSLATDLQNLWIERHDEQINIDGTATVLPGMKYKCYRASSNDYAWVIIGFDGSIMTFERHIKWNNEEHKRITEKWLHDSWLIEKAHSDKRDLRKLVEETFANAALNELNTSEMCRGFHPDFAILIPKDAGLLRLPLHDWIKVVDEYKNSPEKLKSNIRHLDYTIEVIDITGSTAVVKTQFFRDKKLIITDYLSYIRYAAGWQAVAKISNEHITNPLHLDL